MWRKLQLSRRSFPSCCIVTSQRAAPESHAAAVTWWPKRILSWIPSSRAASLRYFRIDGPSAIAFASVHGLKLQPLCTCRRPSGCPDSGTDPRCRRCSFALEDDDAARRALAPQMHGSADTGDSGADDNDFKMLHHTHQESPRFRYSSLQPRCEHAAAKGCEGSVVR